MVSALDEVSTDYGLLAEAVSYPEDFASVTYRLRADARMARRQAGDGGRRDLLVRDLQEAQPDVLGLLPARDQGREDRRARGHLHLRQPGNRELPQIVGQLDVLPKHWWEGTDAAGKKRDVAATTLEPPLGSGAYRIKEFVAGRTIVYERVKDYWGKDLNVNIGRDNFDEIRFEYFRDSTVALEAFKGDQVDWRTENSAKNWATAYDFPAVKDKRVVLEEFPVRNSGVMQAFAFNIRRDKFKDARVRRAFNLAFDFEEMNKQIFFGQYKRIDSYFEGTELASIGPAARARSWRSSRPCATRCRPRSSPRPTPTRSAASPRRCATTCARRRGCCSEAGYEVRNRKLVNAKTGEPFTVEFLADDPDRRALRAVLQAVARTARHRRHRAHGRRRAIREPDAQLGLRHHHRVLGRNRCRPATSSATSGARRRPTSPARATSIGIKNPAVDALIDRVIFAKDRDELVAATQGARPRAAVEPLRRAAMDLRQAAHRALGPLRPARRRCRNMARRRSRPSGGGTRQKAAKTGSRS